MRRSPARFPSRATARSPWPSSRFLRLRSAPARSIRRSRRLSMRWLCGPSARSLSSAPRAEVPNVIDKDLSDAQTLLQVEGFDVQTDTVHRLGPKGRVLEQDPPPGKADQSCDFLKLSCSKPTVTLTVNAGPGRAK